MSICMSLIQADISIRFYVKNDSVKIFYGSGINFVYFVHNKYLKVTLDSPFKMVDQFVGR